MMRGIPYLDPVIGWGEEPEASNCSFEKFNDCLIHHIADGLGIPKDFFRGHLSVASEIYSYYKADLAESVRITQALRDWALPFYIRMEYSYGATRKWLWARDPQRTRAQIRKYIGGAKRVVSVKWRR